MKENRAELKSSVIGYTTKLFKNPFDETWVADAEARAAFEIRLGFGMRTRPVINQRILSDFIGIASKRLPRRRRRRPRRSGATSR